MISSQLANNSSISSSIYQSTGSIGSSISSCSASVCDSQFSTVTPSNYFSYGESSSEVQHLSLKLSPYYPIFSTQSSSFSSILSLATVSALISSSPTSPSIAASAPTISVLGVSSLSQTSSSYVSSVASLPALSSSSILSSTSQASSQISSVQSQISYPTSSFQLSSSTFSSSSLESQISSNERLSSGGSQLSYSTSSGLRSQISSNTRSSSDASQSSYSAYPSSGSHASSSIHSALLSESSEHVGPSSSVDVSRLSSTNSISTSAALSSTSSVENYPNVVITSAPQIFWSEKPSSIKFSDSSQYQTISSYISHLHHIHSSSDYTSSGFISDTSDGGEYEQTESGKVDSTMNTHITEAGDTAVWVITASRNTFTTTIVTRTRQNTVSVTDELTTRTTDYNYYTSQLGGEATSTTDTGTGTTTSSAAATSSSGSDAGSGSGGLSTAEKSGAAVGSVCGGVLLVALVIIYGKKGKRNNDGIVTIIPIIKHSGDNKGAGLGDKELRSFSLAGEGAGQNRSLASMVGSWLNLKALSNTNTDQLTHTAKNSIGSVDSSKITSRQAIIPTIKRKAPPPPPMVYLQKSRDSNPLRKSKGLSDLSIFRNESRTKMSSSSDSRDEGIPSNNYYSRDNVSIGIGDISELPDARNSYHSINSGGIDSYYNRDDDEDSDSLDEELENMDIPAFVPGAFETLFEIDEDGLSTYSKRSNKGKVNTNKQLLGRLSNLTEKPSQDLDIPADSEDINISIGPPIKPCTNKSNPFLNSDRSSVDLHAEAREGKCISLVSLNSASGNVCIYSNHPSLASMSTSELEDYFDRQNSVSRFSRSGSLYQSKANVERSNTTNSTSTRSSNTSRSSRSSRSQLLTRSDTMTGYDN